MGPADSDEILGGAIPEYGFTLRLVNGGVSLYSTCSRCPWLKKCDGMLFIVMFCYLFVEMDTNCENLLHSRGRYVSFLNLFVFLYISCYSGCILPDHAEVEVELRDGESVAVDWHFEVYETILDTTSMCKVKKHSSSTGSNSGGEVGVRI